jgi:hypothetical protein
VKREARSKKRKVREEKHGAKEEPLSYLERG